MRPNNNVGSSNTVKPQDHLMHVTVVSTPSTAKFCKPPWCPASNFHSNTFVAIGFPETLRTMSLWLPSGHNSLCPNTLEFTVVCRGSLQSLTTFPSLQSLSFVRPYSLPLVPDLGMGKLECWRRRMARGNMWTVASKMQGVGQHQTP